MTRPLALLWFRQDLRLADNPALNHALNEGYDILPLYILDDEAAGPWALGGASRWWLHQSLENLNTQLKGKMLFLKGRAQDILPALLTQEGASALFWNRCYEPWRTKRDQKIKDSLKSQNITAKSFNASLLWEPWDVLKDDGTPYKVFTPFYRKGCLSRAEPHAPLPAPKDLPLRAAKSSGALSALNLMPRIQWYDGMAKTWAVGEKAALTRLTTFLEYGLRGYKTERNRPDLENVSRLSPYLHFGEISPRTVWHTARAAGTDQGLEKDIDHFCSELGWREFSHALLYYNPDLPEAPLQPKFAAYPWRDSDADLKRWQRGQTGIPIVDAGMRQLWHTGWMHNRVRMIVGSFLIKNLRLHWRLGEDWFWDTLVDADLANNAASWQWVAGCGADAAPYFRIFNPITQGEKFDPEGTYIRRYIPELQDCPTEFIHKPWEAPALLRAGVSDYPPPMVDLARSRAEALAGYERVKAYTG